MRETVIKDLSFSYPGTDKLVLKDINMDVAEGEFPIHTRPVGLWQKYAAAPSCRSGKADFGRDTYRWKAILRSQPQPRRGIPGLRPVSLDDCRRKHNAGP